MISSKSGNKWKGKPTTSAVGSSALYRVYFSPDLGLTIMDWPDARACAFRIRAPSASWWAGDGSLPFAQGERKGESIYLQMGANFHTMQRKWNAGDLRHRSEFRAKQALPVLE